MTLIILRLRNQSWDLEKIKGTIVALTLGTGVGSGLIINGKAICK
jgi:predicted NBD/HSP70 family sugar kinase